MPLLRIPLEIALAILASWTVAYHLVLGVRSPASWIGILFALLLAVILLCYGRRWLDALRAPVDSSGWKTVLEVVGIGFCTGLFASLSLKPDADDLSYFHRAIVQLDHLDAPVIRGDTVHNLPDLPALSVSHILTSYEYLVAMAARCFGLDPLLVYHQIVPMFMGCLLVFAYFSLLRQFRVRRGAAVLGVILVMLFLLLDGNRHRSFGSTALVRLWQGKTLLWTLLVPVTLMQSRRFLLLPRSAELGLLAMTSIGAVGLSGSGMLLSPTMVLAVSAAWVWQRKPRWFRIKRVLWLNLASSYCLLFAVAHLVQLIPPPADVTIWEGSDWPAHWLSNLALVFGEGRREALRNLFILFIVPFFTVGRLHGRFLVSISLALVSMFANPVTGPVVMAAAGKAVFWRLAYLFPLPLAFGTTATALVGRAGERGRLRVRAGIAVATFSLVALACASTVPFSLRRPWSYNLPPVELAFTLDILDLTREQSVLAPPEEVVVLGLLSPTVRFETGRFQETEHLFRNRGMPEEGRLRVLAQEAVSRCDGSPAHEEAFWKSLKSVSFVVVRRCDSGDLPPVSVRLVKETSWRYLVERDPYLLVGATTEVSPTSVRRP